MLTGVKDVDTIILNKLNDRDLVMVLSVNKYMNRFYKDETFWLNRILHKFSLSSEIINMYVPITSEGNHYFKYYRDIREINITNYYAYLILGSRIGRLDYVIMAINNTNNKNNNINNKNNNIEGNININNIGDDRAIIWASSNNHIEIVKYLVKNGFNIRASDINGPDAPLRLAIKYNNTDIVKYLLSVIKTDNK